MSACRHWNVKLTTEKTWTHFKSHFAAAYRQHKQMQGGTAAHAGFNSANAAMTQNEDQMAEATIGALANLAIATATAADRGVVAALTQANSRHFKQLQDTTSIRNGVTNGSQEVSTHLKAITVGLTVTRLARPTQASHATLATLDTKRRQLGLTTWAEVKPTRNDEQRLKSVEPHPFLNNTKQQ
jgi:hypothetical protein